MKKNLSYKILNILVILGIVITLGILFILPWILPGVFKIFSIDNVMRLPLELNLVNITSIGVYICSVPYLIALFLLKRLCTLLSMKNPFEKEVPKVFSSIAICAFIEFVLVNIVTILIAFIYIFDKNMFFSTIITVSIISLLILLIGFISLISSNLFNMAIEIKDENDKTI